MVIMMMMILSGGGGDTYIKRWSIMEVSQFIQAKAIDH